MVNPTRKIERLERQIERLKKDNDKRKSEYTTLKLENQRLREEIQKTKDECFAKMMLATIKEQDYDKLIVETKAMRDAYETLLSKTKMVLDNIKPTFKKVNKEIKKDIKIK